MEKFNHHFSIFFCSFFMSQFAFLCFVHVLCLLKWRFLPSERIELKKEGILRVRNVHGKYF